MVIWLILEALTNKLFYCWRTFCPVLPLQKGFVFTQFVKSQSINLKSVMLLILFVWFFTCMLLGVYMSLEFSGIKWPSNICSHAGDTSLYLLVSIFILQVHWEFASTSKCKCNQFLQYVKACHFCSIFFQMVKSEECLLFLLSQSPFYKVQSTTVKTPWPL